MQNFLNLISPYILPLQIGFLIVAIGLILLQNRGAGLSSSFGGSSEVYLTRRGVEKSIVNLTVICIVLFVILRFLSLYI